MEGELDRQGEGLYDRMNGIGAHEVIIETPDHVTSLSDLSEKQIEIIPKLTKVADFEWGTGLYINPTPPEEADEFLREIGLP